VTGGGTGLSTVASNSLLYGSGSTALNTLSTVNSSILTTGATGVPTWVATSTLKINLSDVTGTLQAAQFPALSGDLTTTAGSLATTLATVNGSVGTFNNLTVNGKGLVTSASNVAYLTTAITSLNGQTGATQTFATTSNNGGFGFSSATNVHTLNIPTASASSLGLLSSSDFTTFNSKQATISTTWPITLSGATLGFNGLSTSSQAVVGNIPYFTGVNTFGNVGTTTLSASGLLSLSGTTNILGSSPITLSLSLTKGYFAVGSDSNVAQATSTIFISSTGNVGIGTTTPQWPLQVSNATLPQFAIGDSSLTSNKWTFRNAGGYLYIATSSPSTFATSSVSALSIDLNGNLTLSSALSLTSGGTGFSTYTKGDLIIANNTNSLSKLGIGTIGTSGILGISSGLPAWVATSSLNIDVSNTIGTLAVNRGGTGQTTFTGNQLMYGNFSQVATTSLGVTGPITFSGTMGAQVGGGTGNFGCTTAASGVAGCLSSTMFDTFNGKQATIAVTYPITLSGATIGSAFGTTTTIGVGNDLFLYTSHTGVISGVASSSLSLPNTSLQNSNISGVALGGSLFAHTHDTSLTGTSYNGSAAVSDWGLALNHTNTWSVLQNFNYSSTTGYATFQTSSSTLGYIGTLNLTNALSVANGGTGAVTLTGCLTGNGTGAFTASGTCNTSNATVSSVGLSSSGSITVGSTPVTTSGTITANLNMANANTWTALQSFTNASSTLFSANTAWFNNFNATSTTATSTISTGGLTVGTNQFVIQQNSGNIGMGIATPSAKLQILGSDILNTTQTLNVSGSSGTGLVVTNAGNVGIGTTSPSQKLTVQGKSYFSDMVGIGTNSPNAALDVEGLCVTGDTLLPIRRRRKGKKSNLTDGNIGKETSDHDTSDVEWDYLNIAIKDIVEGDEVLSLNENKGIVEYHRIKALMDMGVKQVFELRTKSGRVIRTTANHPYLARLAPGSKPKFFTRFASKITSVLAENPTLASQKQTTQTVGNVKSTTQNHITNSPATPEISESREILTSVSRDTAIPKFINN
jgi:hypothetical protein